MSFLNLTEWKIVKEKEEDQSRVSRVEKCIFKHSVIQMSACGG